MSGGALYTKTGSDEPWRTLERSFPRCSEGDDNCHSASRGPAASTVRVNRALLAAAPGADRPLDRNALLRLHTCTHSQIPYANAARHFKRWYQEDGNVQVIRLFQGEENRRNQRSPGAARTEIVAKRVAPGGTHWAEWSGWILPLGPAGATVFQIMTNNNWAVHIGMGASERNGAHLTVTNFAPRKKATLAKVALGTPVFVRARDDGARNEVYLGDRLVAAGRHERKPGTNFVEFRWGMYKGKYPVEEDMIVGFAGVQVSRYAKGDEPRALPPPQRQPRPEAGARVEAGRHRALLDTHMVPASKCLPSANGAFRLCCVPDGVALFDVRADRIAWKWAADVEGGVSRFFATSGGQVMAYGASGGKALFLERLKRDRYALQLTDDGALLVVAPDGTVATAVGVDGEASYDEARLLVVSNDDGRAPVGEYRRSANHDVPGHDIYKARAVGADEAQRAARCKARCDGDAACAGFVYNVDNETCYFKGRGARFEDRAPATRLDAYFKK